MSRKTKAAKRLQPVRPYHRKATAPDGLRVLFHYLEDPDEPGSCRGGADRAYPVAQELFRRALQDGEFDDSYIQVLMGSVEHMFDGPLIEDDWITEPSHVASTAYQIGLATAFLTLRHMRRAL